MGLKKHGWVGDRRVDYLMDGTADDILWLLHHFQKFLEALEQHLRADPMPVIEDTPPVRTVSKPTTYASSLTSHTKKILHDDLQLSESSDEDWRRCWKVPSRTCFCHLMLCLDYIVLFQITNSDSNPKKGAKKCLQIYSKKKKIPTDHSVITSENSRYSNKV